MDVDLNGMPGINKRQLSNESVSENGENVQTAKKKMRMGLRPANKCHLPSRFNDYIMINNTSDRILDAYGKEICISEVKLPRNHREAMRSKFAEYWRRGELDEMAAMQSKGVLKEIPETEMPINGRVIRTMWVYALKSDHLGYVIRFKARLVALGNWQRPGIDFKETFAPVARMSSFRLVLGIAAELGLKVYGGDINTAYLNAKLSIPQYVKNIEGFPCEVDGHIYIVCKALYGLRQAGREWNDEINQWLITHGFQRSTTEPCLYFKINCNEIMIVLIYVDDILCATNIEGNKTKLFYELGQKYGIKDQGFLHTYLGIEIDQNDLGISIHQKKFTKEILEQFGYDKANGVGNPMEVNMHLVSKADIDKNVLEFDYRGALGKLMYLATSTRPDIAFVVGQLSRFTGNPDTKHVGVLKRVFRYLVSTINYGINYLRTKLPCTCINLRGYCDSDWGGDLETRKSTTGFVFTIAGGAVSWMSRRQTMVALSTAEAEYVAACEAVMEAAGERNILQEMLQNYKINVSIGIDNQSALIMATNPTYSRRTRHVELRWHYVREQVKSGMVSLYKVKGDENPADAFTKPLDKHRLQRLNKMMGVE